MIIRRTKGGIFLFLLQAATSYGELFNSNDRCGAQAKGGVGKWPSNYEMNINNYEVDQSDGMEAAVLRLGGFFWCDFDDACYTAGYPLLLLLTTLPSLQGAATTAATITTTWPTPAT